MVDRACVQRLQKEFKNLCKEPVPGITARPSPTDILEWHYVLEGSKGTPFEGGVYHGKVKFPPEYPYKPPGISMITPNGRFAPHKRICLSMSDFHPETWNPLWSVGSILTGLLSFMVDTAATTGSISSSDAEKQRLARESLDWNMKSPTFRKMFPDWVDRHKSIQAQRAKEAALQAKAQRDRPAAEDSSVKQDEIGKQGKEKRPQKGMGFGTHFWILAFSIAALSCIIMLPLLTMDFSDSPMS